jgi:hypothetical protein
LKASPLGLLPLCGLLPPLRFMVLYGLLPLGRFMALARLLGLSGCRPLLRCRTLMNDVCNMWQMWLLCGKWNGDRLRTRAWGRSTVASQDA